MIKTMTLKINKTTKKIKIETMIKMTKTITTTLENQTTPMINLNLMIKPTKTIKTIKKMLEIKMKTTQMIPTTKIIKTILIVKKAMKPLIIKTTPTIQMIKMILDTQINLMIKMTLMIKTLMIKPT